MAYCFYFDDAFVLLVLHVRTRVRAASLWVGTDVCERRGFERCHLTLRKERLMQILEVFTTKGPVSI